MPIELVQYDVEFVLQGAQQEAEDAFVRAPPVLLRFELNEELHRPSVLRATFASEDPELPFGALGQSTLEFTMARGEDARAFRFFVESVRYLGTFDRAAHFEVIATSALGTLASTRRSRIFANQTPLQVASEVVQPLRDVFDLAFDDAAVATELPSLDYCVQYRESDLEFLYRVCADYGMALRESVRDGRVNVTCSDDNRSFPAAGGDAEDRLIPAAQGAIELADEEAFAVFEIDHSVVPAATKHNHWDFAPTPATLTAEATSEAGGFVAGTHQEHGFRRVTELEGATTLDADLIAQRRHEDLAGAFEVAVGQSNATALSAGTTFELVSHPFADLNRRWLVTRVEHRGAIPFRRASAEFGAEPNYLNSVRCIPADTPYRPAVAARRSSIAGPQTAVVVGPAGEEIHTDKFGRVKVRMHWDTGDAPDEDATCWLRVAQTWAGPGFGAMFLPRVGMEVVVSFLDGDPDRPIVTGCVYNGANAPAYALPDDKTKSSIKTSSSPGGTGFNELTFEDAAGSEEVFLHAQRNLREVVKAAHSQAVGTTQSISVGADQSQKIAGSREVAVTGTETITVTGTPKGSPPPAGRTVTVQQGAHNVIVANGAMLINASQSITLQCGNSAVVVTPSGIALQAASGAMVNLSALLELAAKGSATTMTLGDDGKAEIAAKAGRLELDDNVALTRGTTNGLWLDGATKITADDGAMVELESNAKMAGAKAEVLGNGASVTLATAEATLQGNMNARVSVNDQNAVAITTADVKVQGVAAEIGAQTVTVAGKLVRIN